MCCYKQWEILRSALAQLATYARELRPPIDAQPLANLDREIERRATIVRRFLPIGETVAAIEAELTEAGPAVATVRLLHENVGAIPEPTDRDAARDFLTVGQERLESWRDAMSRYSAARKRAEIAEKVLNSFGQTTTDALNSIYQEVETEFRSFYRTINSDDESQFEVVSQFEF